MKAVELIFTTSLCPNNLMRQSKQAKGFYNFTTYTRCSVVSRTIPFRTNGKTDFNFAFCIAVRFRNYSKFPEV